MLIVIYSGFGVGQVNLVIYPDLRNILSTYLLQHIVNLLDIGITFRVTGIDNM